MTEIPPDRPERVDVLIVGAGLSGVCAAYYLQARCPGKTYAIVEARAAMGGTWDLFRYPGVRSDSDMYTLGYSFRPWPEPEAIASGASILSYVRDTAREYGIDRNIRYNQRVQRAHWSSADAAWNVDVATGAAGEIKRYRCNFLYMCSGYYDYESGYTPEFAGIDRFRGRVIHPQRWMSDVDYAGKRVVVIGSGATAVTLVPEMAKTAAHVTMLQRSPTYVIARPDQDRLVNALRRIVPASLALAFARWKAILLGMLFFQMCKRWPERVKGLILQGVRVALGPSYDVAKHFTPSYKPWDQRLCLVPNGDLFTAIREERASVVTDHIDSFVANGIKLRSGAELEADLIVTATGLNLQPLGGIQISVDGAPIELSSALTYKGMMLNNVPNFAIATGYTNASWTLKCELTAQYVCRLLRHMTRHALRQCTPSNHDPSIEAQPAFDFSSGYVVRAIHKMPKQGSKVPWRLHQNYTRDLLELRYGRLEDGVMEFSNPMRAPTDDASGPKSSLPPRRLERQDGLDRPAVHS